MNPLSNAALYLINTLFGLYIIAILLRFMLQVARADFYNPLSQAIVKITDPGVRPLRKIIPGFGGVDFSTLLLALIVQLLAIYLIAMLGGLGIPNPIYAIGWAALGLLNTVLNIYFFALILMVILSWVAPHSYNPAAVLVVQLVEPIIRPVRNLIPPLGGLDLSPIFVFILINLFKIVLIEPLHARLFVPPGLLMGL